MSFLLEPRKNLHLENNNDYFLALATFEGHIRKSKIERSLSSKLFYFYLFNTFLISVIAGSIITEIQTVIDRPQSLVASLGRALPGRAMFFVTYVLLSTTELCIFLLQVCFCLQKW